MIDNKKDSLAFWIFGGGLGIIGALTNNLQMLLFAGLAIIVFNPRWKKERILQRNLRDNKVYVEGDELE